jgi:Fe2+ or Zn2+ uptake regulation protein
MKSEIEVFREFIRNKGLRKTPEREQVVRAVFAIHDHFDVDELYVLLRGQNERISKATIYRAASSRKPTSRMVICTTNISMGMNTTATFVV